MLRLSLEADPAERARLPLRQGRAIAWIEEALTPLRSQMCGGRRARSSVGRRREPDAGWEPVGMSDDRTVTLEAWTGPWPDDDPDANVKADIATYAHVDPLTTLRNLSRHLDVPIGALCHYVLAQWATAGSGGLLELGPTMTRRLGDVCNRAETQGTDAARLAAYAQLRDMISWLRYPLDHPDAYGD